jgi:hypothetical protein
VLRHSFQKLTARRLIIQSLSLLPLLLSLPLPLTVHGGHSVRALVRVCMRAYVRACVP